jgi:hypothetical protein
MEKVASYGLYSCSKFIMKSVRGIDLGPLRWP